MILVAVLLLLVTALLVLTQTAFFREKLKNRFVAEVEKYIEPDLSINELNGNLYEKIELVGVTLTQQDSLVAHLDSLKLSYQLLPLLKREILIESIEIDSPEIHLNQKKDSTWNVSEIVVESGQKSTNSKGKKTFVIKIKLFELINGRLVVQSLMEMIPEKIENLDIRANAEINGDNMEINLQGMNFLALHPDIRLNELSANYRMNDQAILIDNLVLRTEGTSLAANAGYQSLQNMDGNIDAEPIDRNELKIFIPKLHLLCSPQLTTHFETNEDKLTANLELANGDQSVNAEIQLAPFSKLTSGEGPVPYSASLDFSNFSAEDWIELNNINSKLEGKVDVSGVNLLDRDAKLSLNANLRNSSYNEVRFNTLKIDGNWQNDNLSALLDAQTDFGGITGNGKINHLSTRKQFAVDLFTKNFNLSAFFPSLDETVLNGRFVANGSGFELENMRADADVWLSESTVYGYEIESLNSTMKLSKAAVFLDSIRVFVPGANAVGNGRVQIDSSRLDLELHAHIDSLSLIDSLVQLPVEFDSVNSVSIISGPFTELSISGDADVYNAKGYGIELPSASSSYLVSLKTDSLNVAAVARSGEFHYMDIRWDSMFVDFNYLNGQVDVSGRIVEQDTLDLKATMHMQLGDTLRIKVPKLEMNTLLSDYYLNDTVSASVAGTDKIELRNFLLLDRNNPDFELRADGHVSTLDTNDFHLLINELDMMQLNRFMPDRDTVRGIMNAEVNLAGSSAEPIIEGTVDLKKPGYGDFNLAAINGSYILKDQEFTAEINNPELEQSFSASFSTPLKMYLDSLQFAFSPPDSFNAKIDIYDIQVHKYLADLVPNDSVSGLLNMQVEASGDFQRPQIFGSIRIDNAVYQNKKLGLDYNNAKAVVHFKGNKMTLDTMYIKQEDGMISLSGDLVFDSTFVTGNIISSSLKADANNFYVARNRNYEILIDANTFLEMGQNNPEFGGKIKVLRSDIFLPAVITREIQETDENDPMLVQALNEQRDTIHVDQSEDAKKNEQENKKSSLLDDITGRLNVEIPRNTWIRGDQMRLEVRGDVDIVKTGPYFELFGNLQIPRGHYILYGKKLNIKDSEVIFNGGEEFDPSLNFKAEYVFRDQDREKRYLELLITGKLSDPSINFKLNDADISETDGMSVLLFGTTSDQIGFSEQNGLVGSIGSNALAGLITSQLSRTLGAQLNLDMIEVTATENWKSAAFVVGKYITNDIFVIYERGFGEEEGNEITPETITVEYELNDKLFLRLQSGSSITSGIDVILKFEQELEK